jgi:hypothetical protein
MATKVDDDSVRAAGKSRAPTLAKTSNVLAGHLDSTLA